MNSHLTSPDVMNSQDRKSTRLNSSHTCISYAVFCLKKNNQNNYTTHTTPQHLHTHTDTHKRTHTLSPSHSPPHTLTHSLPHTPTHTLTLFFLMIRRPPRSTPFPYTPIFR